MPRESATLYYREGSSDKVYQAAVEEVAGGFVVNFAYGRRGSTLNTGTKTQSPVPFDQAKKVFDALVQSKISKGYTPGETGTPYQHTEQETRATGLLPQLCNPITADEVTDLLDNDDYYLQQKFDGKRILLKKDSDVVVGINRKGLVVSLPEPIVNAAKQYTESFLLDGECIGDVLHVFDLLGWGRLSLLASPYNERSEILQRTLVVVNDHLLLVPTAVTPTEKSRLLLKLKGANKEGVVFKRHAAPYTSGRPASGGSWLKHKFTISGSFIVAMVNSQRSVGLEAVKGTEHVFVGNVTIPPNKQVPKLGCIVEVRYLYAYQGGSLYQPVYLHEREDLDAKDCIIGQLKYKAENSEGEEG